jgi:hypothetical protein
MNMEGLYLLVFSTLYFFGDLAFNCAEFLTFFVKVISRWFFEATMNGISFLTSFSANLLLYRKATDFYILILYPAKLPNVFIRCKSLLVETLSFLSVGSHYLHTGIIRILPFLSVSILCVPLPYYCS